MAICGAVPCTRQAIHHRTDCHELKPSQVHSDPVPDNIYAEVMVEYRQDNYNWTWKNMKELESLNHASYQWLLEKGYNAKALKIKANVRPNNLLESRIAAASTVVEHVKATVASGISLSLLFHTIGPTCLSVDEIFIPINCHNNCLAITVMRSLL